MGSATALVLRAVSKATAALIVAAAVAACSHQSSSVLPSSTLLPTSASSTASRLTGLDKARQITAQSCTFSAPGKTDGNSFDENTTAWVNSSMSASGPAL